MQVDKYTIAWFKIAECVSRGEKERALGVYRLLSHSFNDNAIAAQLEGDIYLSFGDQDQACELYRHAIQLYKKSGKLLEAAAVSEHLLTLHPHDYQQMADLVALYQHIGITLKMHTYSNRLVDYYAHKKEWEKIELLSAMLIDDKWLAVRMGMYRHIIITAWGLSGASDRIHYYIEKAVCDVLMNENQMLLQEFLLAMQSIDDELYDHACDYIKKTR